MDPEDYKTIKLTPENPHASLGFAGEFRGGDDRGMGEPCHRQHEEGYGQIFIR
jgi:hypothetical protein